MIASVGWQVAPYDPIVMISCNSKVLVARTAIRLLNLHINGATIIHKMGLFGLSAVKGQPMDHSWSGLLRLPCSVGRLFCIVDKLVIVRTPSVIFRVNKFYAQILGLQFSHFGSSFIPLVRSVTK